MADELLTRLRQWADEDWVQRLAIGDPTEDGYRLSHDIRAAVNALADRDRRIEALTKALEGTLSWLTSYPGGLPMAPGGAYDRARKALASAAGAEGA